MSNASQQSDLPAFDKQSGALKPAARIPLWAFGMGIFLAVDVYFLWGVAPIFDSGMSIREYDALMSPFRGAVSSSIAITALLAGVVALATKRAFPKIALFYIESILFIFGYALFFAGAFVQGNNVLYMLAGCCVGVSNALVFLQWGAILSSFDASATLRILLVSGVISGLGTSILLLMHPLWAYIVLGPLIVVCMLMLKRGLRFQGEFGIEREPLSVIACFRNLALAFGRPLLCVAALGFVFNATREIAFGDFGNTHFINLVSMVGLFLATGAILLLLHYSVVGASQLDRIYPYIALVASACLIPTPFLGSQYRIVFNVFISCIYLLVVTLLKATLADVVRTKRIDSQCVFGLGLGIVFASVGLGTAVGTIPRSFEEMSSLVLMLTIVLVAIYILFVPAVFVRRSQKTRTVILPFDEQSLKQRCSDLAQRYAITDSERAVMELLSQGMTFSAAAKELTLSENTVRSHSKSIYRKMGIHTKQELIDIVGGKSGRK